MNLSDSMKAQGFSVGDDGKLYRYDNRDRPYEKLVTLEGWTFFERDDAGASSVIECKENDQTGLFVHDGGQLARDSLEAVTWDIATLGAYPSYMSEDFQKRCDYLLASNPDAMYRHDINASKIAEEALNNGPQQRLKAVARDVLNEHLSDLGAAGIQFTTSQFDAMVEGFCNHFETVEGAWDDAIADAFECAGVDEIDFGHEQGIDEVVQAAHEAADISRGEGPSGRASAYEHDAL